LLIAIIVKRKFMRKENTLLDLIRILRKKCVERESEIKKKLGLSEAEFQGLQCIDENEKITCQIFSERMNLSVSRGTRIIDRLFRKGYFDRTDCSEDRRCKNIRLTLSGLEIKNKIEKLNRECEKKLTRNLTEKRIIALKKELNRLMSQL
jgi:DNA-binding MarR family transcriptional regulator